MTFAYVAGVPPTTVPAGTVMLHAWVRIGVVFETSYTRAVVDVDPSQMPRFCTPAPVVSAVMAVDVMLDRLDGLSPMTFTFVLWLKQTHTVFPVLTSIDTLPGLDAAVMVVESAEPAIVYLLTVTRLPPDVVP
jgi:hypothetical protein